MSNSILEEINQDVGLNDAFFERVHEQYSTKNGHTILMDVKKKFEEIGRYDTFEYAYLDFLERNYPDDWLVVYDMLNKDTKRNNTKTVFDKGVFRPMKQVPMLEATNAFDLSKAEIAPLEYLIENVLPTEGLGMLGAPSKYYKSYLCIDMGICISNGTKFLGYNTKRCGVLYLDLESTKRRPRDRINQITKNAPKNFYIITGEQPVAHIGEGLESQLKNQLEQHEDIGLIIIDVLKKVRPTQKRGVNDYDRDYEDLGKLKSFADSNKICILLVHHTRKMKDPDDPFNELSGSTAVMGVLDAAFVISRKKREDKESVLHMTGRDIDQKALTIQFNQETFRWENLGNTEDVEYNKMLNEYNQSKIVNVVRALLKQFNGEMTYSVKELVEASQYVCSGKYRIHDTPQKIGLDLAKYMSLFTEIDGIKVVKQNKDRRGNMTWHFLNTLSNYPYSP